MHVAQWRTWGLVAVALAVFVSPAWVADETCTATDGQCSLEIAVTATNSEVIFPFVTTDVCVTSSAVSENIAYVKWTPNDAVADADNSHPLPIGATVCLREGKSTDEVNLIAAAAETATVQVLALRLR